MNACCASSQETTFGTASAGSELAQPPRDGDGHVRDAVGAQLRLQTSAVVRGAAKIEELAGGSRHGGDACSLR